MNREAHTADRADLSNAKASASSVFRTVVHGRAWHGIRKSRVLSKVPLGPGSDPHVFQVLNPNLEGQFAN